MSLRSDRVLDAEALGRELGTPGLLVLDVSAREHHVDGHVPGAVWVAIEELVDGARPAVGRLPSAERLQAFCRRVGLNAASAVVVCDDEGGGWAGRLAWNLEMAGASRWRYLDGGLVAWRAAGMPVETRVRVPLPSDYQVLPSPQWRIGFDELRGRLGSSDLVVWDARSAAEWAGQRSGSRHAGRIPGAVNVDWLELMDRGRDLRLREDLAEFLAGRGITPDREIVCHCQTHHRSGLAWIALRALGYPRVRAYDGSWSEWGNRDDAPIER
jgi:thiosulfate/3-mercaptopyruvate sulfurtransferase